MTIILVSACVSLLTLAILLFNPVRPTRFRIPSAFLGGLRFRAPRRLRLTPPPLLLWLLVVLATLGVGASYFPWADLAAGRSQAGHVVVWPDETFSARVAFARSEVEIEELATEVLDLGNVVHGLVPEYEVGDKGVTVSYSLVKLDSTDAAQRFLSDAFVKGSPIAFARPLDPEALRKLVAATPALADGRGGFAVVTDGQRSTLEGLLPVRESFASVRVLRVGAADDLKCDRCEDIVPVELLQLWSQPDADSHGGQAYVVSGDSRIPDAARPLLVREGFGTADRQLALVSSGAGDKGGLLPRLITVCSDRAPGPVELDPFSDLRVFATYVGSYVRVERCFDPDAANAAETGQNAWRFRRPTLWVVPLEEYVLASLYNEGQPWIPSGFLPETDSLVYVASGSISRHFRDVVQMAPVQLDKDAAPVVVYLSIPPPASLGSGQGEPIPFRPVFRSSDGTELGFRLGDSRIHFLRTTAAMPNGELARSANWIRFWMDAARVSSRGGQGLSRVEWTDLDSARTNSEEDPLGSYAMILNPVSLALDDANLAARGFRLGLHVSSANFGNLLVDVPAAERVVSFYAPGEFESLWRTAKAEGEHSSRHGALWLSLGGAVLATLALGALWLRPRTAATMLLVGLGALGSRRASAQNTDDLPPNSIPQPMLDFLSQSLQASRTNDKALHQRVPFRIAWCAPHVPDVVAATYARQREMLSRTGTIRLPETLLAGKCHPGEAEIWWTDNAALLGASEVGAHLSGSGVFVLEGQGALPPSGPGELAGVAQPALGLEWEKAPRRGMLYRSFYLLSSFDGCSDDGTLLLRLRKKPNAQVPLGIATGARLLSSGSDCFGGDQEWRRRSFVNLMYAILTTDYKEDQLHLPEILGRIRNLGLEP